MNGTLYRTGEYILADDDDDDGQMLIRATSFFTVPAGDQGQHIAFVKGELYEPLRSVDGSALLHPYSSSPIVQPTSQTEVIPAATIMRKVMLYPDPNNLDSPSSYVVIDFSRPFPPFETKDIVVPACPETGDMVQVLGEGEEIWYAKVLSTNTKDQMCQIHFYVEDGNHPGRYVRETFGRAAMELLHWDSIIGIVSGHWEGNVWYFE